MGIHCRIILFQLIWICALSLGAIAPSSVARAAEPVQLNPDFSSHRIGSVDTWIGPDDRNIQELAHAPAERTNDGHFGYTRQTIWLRFSVKNTEASAVLWALITHPPLIDEVVMYQLDSSDRVIQTSAFEVDRSAPLPPGTSRALLRRRPTFLVSIAPNSTNTFILRLRSYHILNLRLDLLSPAAEEARHLHEQLTFGAYYGLFFTILLLNLIVWAATRDRLYLDYVLFLISGFVMLSCLNGVLDYNFGEYFDFSRYLGVTSALTMTCGNLFTRSFLQTKRIVPRLDRIHLSIAIIGILLAIIDASPLFPHISAFYGHSIDLFIGISLIAIIASTFVTLYKGHSPAIFFLLAWGVFLTFTVFYFLGTYGVIRYSFNNQSPVQIGASLEMILLSIALGFRVHTMKEEKVAAEKKAEETDALRSLIHIICHDLRNPLTVMSGHAEIQLRRGKSEWQPVARAAQTQKEILDYVQIKESIESGKKQLDLIPVSLVDAVENARFLFEDRMEEKKIRWDSQLAEEHIVLADPTLLTYTVISNLISNAIKFTNTHGLIEIRSRTDGAEVELEVRDTGIGIPEPLIENLFSSAVATTRAGTDGEQGTGFGMPLVKTVMEFFGGSISVRSSVAGKSTPQSPCGTSMILRLKRAN